jgi:glycosyltransferase involved in cell wall biosynthesis
VALPFLVVSDGPNTSTGLGRIARDLMHLLWANRAELDIELVQLGLHYNWSPWPWRCFRIEHEEEWGKVDLQKMWTMMGWPEKGVVFTIWDPGRCFGPLLVPLPAKTQRWGYFALDAVNSLGGIGGPAAEVVRGYTRVLGYGRWGSRVLRGLREQAVPYLPHGLDLRVFRATPGVPRTVVGAVATNHPRKDLGLLFMVWKVLAERDPGLAFWLHTHASVTEAWSVPELAEQAGLNNERLTVTVENLTDEGLAQCYSQCLVTIAPGLGEGFGYPIAESLACGAPVIHGDYAGGAELVPRREWRSPPRDFRLEGAYALERPLLDAGDFADRAWEAIQWAREEPEVVQAYCRGAVAHFDWGALQPRWLSWIRKGLRDV